MDRHEQKRLCRIPERGKVAGVCAGLAEYFNLEVWLVRILVLSAILLTGVFGFAMLLYVAAWVLLDKRPAAASTAPPELKTRIWQAGEAPREALRDISGRFGALERRLQQLEHYVTSDAYRLKREIDNLK